MRKKMVGCIHAFSSTFEKFLKETEHRDDLRIVSLMNHPELKVSVDQVCAIDIFSKFKAESTTRLFRKELVYSYDIIAGNLENKIKMAQDRVGREIDRMYGACVREGAAKWQGVKNRMQIRRDGGIYNVSGQYSGSGGNIAENLQHFVPGIEEAHLYFRPIRPSVITIKAFTSNEIAANSASRLLMKLDIKRVLPFFAPIGHSFIIRIYENF